MSGAEVMLGSCASVGDAMWWQLGLAGEDVGVLEFLSDEVVWSVGSW